MTAKEQNEVLAEWLQQHPMVAVYFAALFLGAVISFIWLIRGFIIDRRFDQRSISAWAIRPGEFAIFICVMVAWFSLSGIAIAQLVSKSMENQDNALLWGMLVGNTFMQIGMAYIFIRFRFQFQNPAEGPLSPRQTSTWAAMRLGFFYFLASLPVIYFVGVIWGMITQMLTEIGLPWEPVPQDAITMFQEMKDPRLILAMVLLAVIVAPIVEELVFRAGIFRFLKGRFPQWIAILASSILFGLVHGNIQSLAGLIAVGACLCIAYELSGNLKVPIFFHAFFNLNTLVLLMILPEGLI
jgi:membrane protease YdiL (CAAX protease family)